MASFLTPTRPFRPLSSPLHAATGHGPACDGTVSQAPSHVPARRHPGPTGHRDALSHTAGKSPLHGARARLFRTLHPLTPHTVDHLLRTTTGRSWPPRSWLREWLSRFTHSKYVCDMPSAKTTRARSVGYYQGPARNYQGPALVPRTCGEWERASVGNRRPCPSFSYLYTNPCYRRPLIFLHHANDLVLLRRL